MPGLLRGKGDDQRRAMPELSLTGLISRLNAATSFEAAVAVFSECAGNVGFDVIAYNILRRDHRSLSFHEGVAISAGNAEIDAHMSGERQIDFDPAVRRLIMAMRPFHWFDPELARDVTPEQLAILATVRRDGFVDGLSFPVSDGPGDLALLSLSSRGRRFDFDQTTANLFQFACLAVHQRCKAFAASPTAAATDLSRREQEIARLILRGQSNKEIARRLGISAHTVDAFLRRIFEKLQVDNRIEAAVKFALITGAFSTR